MSNAHNHGMQVYLNGSFLPLDQAKVSVLDRGFIFGDGIYEVIPIYNRKPFLINNHLARLKRSLNRISLNCDYSEEEWLLLIKNLIETFPNKNGLIYIQITRGVAKREHGFPDLSVKPTVFAMISPFDFPDTHLRNKGISAIRKNDDRWLMCDIKSISLLGNVLAKQYATDHLVDEVIQFRNGILTEGSSCNIWVVKDNTLMRPIADINILQGIRYSFMGDAAKQLGISLVTKDITESDVIEADELLATSATKEILPITLYENKSVGSGAPGPIFKQLRKAYDVAIANI